MVKDSICHYNVGGAVVATLGLAAPGAGGPATILLGLVTMYCGVAFDRPRFLTALVVGSLALVATTLAHHPDGARLWSLTGTLVTTTAIGTALHWLRGLLDADREIALAAQRAAADQEGAVRDEQDRQRLAATRATAAETTRRTGITTELAGHASGLTAAAEEVRRRSATVAGATAEMSAALRELSRNAEASRTITAAVSGEAQRTGELMAQLSASGERITAASEVIRAVAERTNLLSVNATIESARAGDAGRGFAVVAAEVKELATQSADNAGQIAGTLAEVQHQIRQATAEVGGIVTRTNELAGHNTTLASAVEEQSATVGHIVASIDGAAEQAGVIADGIGAVERLARDLSGEELPG